MKNYLGEKVLINFKESNRSLHGKKLLTLVDVEDSDIVLMDDDGNNHTVPFSNILTCNLSPDFQALLREKNEKH